MFYRYGHYPFLILLFAIFLAAPNGYAQEITEEDVTFHSGDTPLQGTLLIPDRDAPGPAIVLIHGAGPGRRDNYRDVAQALAGEGFLVLIYDKRSEGYSTGPVGDRSYALLATDAIAAVHMLQQRDDVDPTQVGLWGLSEGGWVAPLAATRSDDVAFVITVAGGGIGPLEQTAWATERALRQQGVTSEGTLRALTEHSFRFLVSAELFSEGTFDPVPVLQQLRQPVLAIWGAEDHLMPAAASARAMQQALEQGGNRHYVMRIIPNATHNAHIVVNGQSGEALAPGYVDLMTSWAGDVLAGNVPGPAIDDLPAGERPTRPAARNRQGFARWQIQLGFFAAFHLLFAGYFFVGLVRRFRRQHRPAPGRRFARAIASLGLIVAWGVFAYTGFISATGGEMVAAVMAGRPAVWLALQLLALLLLLLTILLGAYLYRQRNSLPHNERTRLALVLIGALLFLPWAAWWQLFSL